MSTQANAQATATVAEIVASKAMIQAYSKISGAEVKLGQAIDDYRRLCKTEATKNGWDKKQLTLAILSSGCKDPARASEYATFVFPKSADARPVLDEILEYNARQDDPKNRIEKSAILAVSRAKGTAEDPIKSVADLLEEKRQKALAGATARTPKGKTDQVAHKATGKSEKTGDELDAELGTFIAAALNFAKSNGYSQEDVGPIWEEWMDKILPEAEADEEESDITDGSEEAQENLV